MIALRRKLPTLILFLLARCVNLSYLSGNLSTRIFVYQADK
jgi:hypothetical protein